MDHVSLFDTLNAYRERQIRAIHLLPMLFRRKLDMHLSGFASGEAIDYVNALYLRDHVHRHRGDDGVIRSSA